MSTNQIIYISFIGIVLLALVIDLGLISKKNKAISIKKAFIQTVFWVLLSLGFCLFLWIEIKYRDGNATYASNIALKYISAYLMEWSLSIDNIFVFILIFSFFKISEEESGRALLIGILLAIVLRIMFIALGIELINRFHWLLYVFGVFLLYTGIKLYFKSDEEEFKPSESKIYQWANRLFRITDIESKGRYFIIHNNKFYFTILSVVVLMLAATDLVFAVDSIPTVVSLVRENAKIPFSEDEILVIYSSNIFAVLGLRSLFFLLRGAINKFAFLQQGIAVVLIYIGVKMLIEIVHIHIPIYFSLLIIIISLSASILYSVYHNRKGLPPVIKE